MLIGLLLGGIIIGIMAYASRKWDDALVYSDIQTAVFLDTRSHEHWLAVRYHIDSIRSCPSWSQHLIYKDNTVDNHIQRNFVPLAITANGIGASTDVHDFALSFRLPPDLESGKWWYIVVTSAQCEWLPGLVRPAVTETTPVEVKIR